MGTFSALLALCAGNSPVTGEFPSQRPVTRSFDVFLHLHLNKLLRNNWDAGDFRCHHAHYYIIVIVYCCAVTQGHSGDLPSKIIPDNFFNFFNVIDVVIRIMNITSLHKLIYHHSDILGSIFFCSSRQIYKVVHSAEWKHIKAGFCCTPSINSFLVRLGKSSSLWSNGRLRRSRNKLRI